MKKRTNDSTGPVYPGSCNSFAPLPNMLSDKEARRQYTTTGLVGGIVCQLLFAFFIGSDDFALENRLDLASAAMLAVALFLLIRTQYHQAAYRVGIFTLLFIITYTVLFPNHEISALIQIYYVAPAVIFYTVGMAEGLLWLSFSWIPILMFQLTPSLFNRTSLSPSLIIDYWACMGTIIALSLISEWLRRKKWALYTQTYSAFKKATDRLDQLEGLIPICCYCKKIRDDDGYWRKVETYLKGHASAPAHISRGVCDSCASQNRSLKETDSFPVPEELTALFSWRDSLDKTTRKYLQYAVVLGIPIMWSFTGRDLAYGYWGVAVTQILISLVLIVAALHIRYAKQVSLAYHITIFVLFAFLITPFFFATPVGTEKLWLHLFPLAASLVLPFMATLLWTLAMQIFSIFLFHLPFFTDVFQVADDDFTFFTATYMAIGLFALSTKRIRSLYTKRIENHVNALEKTYQSIRTVKGLVPVCSVCNSIRNDDGYWERIESYLSNHTDIQLTHGICAECLKREMPDLHEEMKTSGKL